MDKTTIKAFLRLILLSAVIFLQQAVATAAEPEGRPIRLGMSTALSGPSQYLGQSMYRGVSDAIALVNSRGGVSGRPLELIVMDDAYIPELAASNSMQLIDEEEVIAIIGNVGTPTAEAVVPVIQDRGVVFFGAFTGSNSLRLVEKNDYVFNYRASYEQEMEIIVRHIMASNISPRKIALLLQANETGELDGFGNAGLEAVRHALSRVGFEYVDELIRARYEANSLQTDYAITQILDADYSPEAFVIVGSYQPSSHFIRYMHRLYPNANFYNLSFAGAGALANSLSGAEKNHALDLHDRIYMTQVVPTAESQPSEEFADLVEREAHLTAQFFIDALGKIEGEIARESVNQILRAIFDRTSPTRLDSGITTSELYPNQASDYVVLTQFKAGEWLAVK